LSSAGNPRILCSCHNGTAFANTLPGTEHLFRPARLAYINKELKAKAVPVSPKKPENFLIENPVSPPRIRKNFVSDLPIVLLWLIFSAEDRWSGRDRILIRLSLRKNFRPSLDVLAGSVTIPVERTIEARIES